MKEVKARKIELATVRLIIRTPQERDVHDIFVLMSDLEIAAITGFRPMNTLSEAEGKIRREMDGGLMFCILEKNLPEKVLVFLKSLRTKQILFRVRNATMRYVISSIKKPEGKAI